MPRRARLDIPGTVNHVIVRGIERRKIVNDAAASVLGSGRAKCLIWGEVMLNLPSKIGL